MITSLIAIPELPNFGNMITSTRIEHVRITASGGAQYFTNSGPSSYSEASRGVLIKRCSENIQQIRRIPMLESNFSKVAMQLY